MDYRLFGRTGVRVSPLCLGAMNFGDATNEADSIRIVHAALDAGINFVDTANVYNAGRSEVAVGKALAGRRDQKAALTASEFARCAGPLEQQLGHIVTLNKYAICYLPTAICQCPSGPSSPSNPSHNPRAD